MKGHERNLGVLGRRTVSRMLRLFFGGVLLAVGGLWLVSLQAGALTGGFWALRGTLIYGAGVLALGSMSVAVILASRPGWIEDLLGGLDKYYRLHRWFAISGLTLGRLLGKSRYRGDRRRRPRRRNCDLVSDASESLSEQPTLWTAR
jgi:hypothetical protein